MSKDVRHELLSWLAQQEPHVDKDAYYLLCGDQMLYPFQGTYDELLYWVPRMYIEIYPGRWRLVKVASGPFLEADIRVAPPPPLVPDEILDKFIGDGFPEPAPTPKRPWWRFWG